MPGRRGGDAPYSYTFRLETPQDAEPQYSESEILSSISDTLMALTGGCESCVHSGGGFCSKHHKQVREGDPRCDLFVRRQQREGGQAAAERQRQAYVVDELGVSEKSARRLLGIQ